MFGEDVLGYLRVEKEGPKWQYGLWLGKVASDDMHVVRGDRIFFDEKHQAQCSCLQLEQVLRS